MQHGTREKDLFGEEPFCSTNIFTRMPTGHVLFIIPLFTRTPELSDTWQIIRRLTFNFLQVLFNNIFVFFWKPGGTGNFEKNVLCRNPSIRFLN